MKLKTRKDIWDTLRRVCGNVCLSGPGVPPSGAESPAQAGSADMLPKVETESLGLTRSYGEQGHMPRNMQGKNCHSFSSLKTTKQIHTLPVNSIYGALSG